MPGPEADAASGTPYVACSRTVPPLLPAAGGVAPHQGSASAPPKGAGAVIEGVVSLLVIASTRGAALAGGATGGELSVSSPSAPEGKPPLLTGQPWLRAYRRASHGTGYSAADAGQPAPLRDSMRASSGASASNDASGRPPSAKWRQSAAPAGGATRALFPLLGITNPVTLTLASGRRPAIASPRRSVHSSRAEGAPLMLPAAGSASGTTTVVVT